MEDGFSSNADFGRRGSRRGFNGGASEGFSRGRGFAGSGTNNNADYGEGNRPSFSRGRGFGGGARYENSDQGNSRGGGFNRGGRSMNYDKSGDGESNSGGGFGQSRPKDEAGFGGQGGSGNRGFGRGRGSFGDGSSSSSRGFGQRGGFNDRSNSGGGNEESRNSGGGFRGRGGFSNDGGSGGRGGFGNDGGFGGRGGFGNDGGSGGRGGFGNDGGFGGRGGFGNDGGFGGRGGYGKYGGDDNSNNDQSSSVPGRGGFGTRGGMKPIPWGELRANLAKTQFAPWEKEPPIQKDFYNEAPEIANMTKEQKEAFFAEMNNISVQDLKTESSSKRSIPNPVRSFEQAWSPYPGILEEVYKNKFKDPTPIQCQAWPVLLKGMDFIGIAQTGTGKTLAFLLPAFIHIEGQIRPRPERSGPTVLVLSPTRELAIQIQGEVEKYAYMGIRCVCVYGGGSRREQVAQVEKGVEIVVATPGRLNDIVNSGILSLFHVSYLILDEADRMLDMGFEPQIIRAISKIRPDRQTVMTSATWPAGVRRIAEKYMTDPVQCFVGSLDLAAVHSVTQYIEIVEDDDKRPRIMRFVSEEMQPEDKVIIFVSRKIYADQIASEMIVNGIDAEAIHGDRDQRDRELALKMFRSGEVRILIATDLASRGLDVKDITHVINMDMPKNMEEYVHRVGRTGRAGATGSSLTFVTRQDWTKVGELIKILEEANQEVSVELRRMAERWERKKAEGPTFGSGRRGGRRDDYGSGVVF